MSKTEITPGADYARLIDALMESEKPRPTVERLEPRSYAQVMPRFTGTLAKRINPRPLPDPGEVGSPGQAGGGVLSSLSETFEAAWEARQAHLHDVRMGKIIALAEAYGMDVETGKAGFWAVLAMRLAVDFIPGFQITEPGKRKPGKPRTAPAHDLELMVEVRRLLRAKPGTPDTPAETVQNACRLLSEREGIFRGKKPSTLTRRYWAVESQFRKTYRLADYPVSQ